jgi:hypothetical protein
MALSCSSLPPPIHKTQVTEMGTGVVTTMCQKRHCSDEPQFHRFEKPSGTPRLPRPQERKRVLAITLGPRDPVSAIMLDCQIGRSMPGTCTPFPKGQAPRRPMSAPSWVPALPWWQDTAGNLRLPPPSHCTPLTPSWALPPLHSLEARALPLITVRRKWFCKASQGLWRLAQGTRLLNNWDFFFSVFRNCYLKRYNHPNCLYDP